MTTQSNVSVYDDHIAELVTKPGHDVLREYLDQVEAETALTEQLAPVIVESQKWTAPQTFADLFNELGV